MKSSWSVRVHFLSVNFALAFLLVSWSANGQGGLFPGPPIVGGTGGLAFPETSNKFRYGSGLPDQHKNPSGQPCVTVNGRAQAQIINSRIFEHVLVIENKCSAPIGLNLCYYQSKSCVHTTIAGYTRRQQNLGIAPESEFRFSYTEDFR
jgi:hypothetical protein